MNDQLQKQEKIHLKINIVILTIAFVVATIAVSLAKLFSPMHLWLYIGLLTGMWLLYWVLNRFISAQHRWFSYYMDERGLFINQGVFWRRKIVVPINRVQHTDITQGPLARRFDLAELTVFTAGTRSASVKIEGILHKDASKLRSQLSFKESEDAV